MSDVDQVTAPRPIRIAGMLVLVQAVALLGLAVGLVVELVVSTAHRVWIPLALAGMCVLAAAVLAGCSRALQRRRLSARTPVVMLELLCLPVGWGLLQAGRYAIGVPLIAVAVAVLGGLFTSSARTWF